MNDWCILNIDLCMGSDPQMDQRLLNKLPVIISSVIDLFQVAIYPDQCGGDREFIEAISRVVKDFVSLTSTLIGFDRQFDMSAQVPHYSMKEFDQVQSKYYKEHMKEIVQDETDNFLE